MTLSIFNIINVQDILKARMVKLLFFLGNLETLSCSFCVFLMPRQSSDTFQRRRISKLKCKNYKSIFVKNQNFLYVKSIKISCMHL